MFLANYISNLEEIQKRAGNQKVRVIRDTDLGWQDAPAPKVTTVELDDLMSSEFLAGLTPGTVVVEI